MSTMNIAMCGSNRDFSRKKSGGGGGGDLGLMKMEGQLYRKI